MPSPTPLTSSDIQTFEQNGFLQLNNLLSPQACEQLLAGIELSGSHRAGSRCLLTQPWCATLAQQLRSSSPLCNLLDNMVAVQCTYFEKSTERNWIVTPHQDLSIPVAAQIEHPSLQGWSKKEGSWFVQAPEPILQQLIAVRIHLDPCGIQDGPVKVYSGSHRLGKIDPAHAAEAKHHFTEIICSGEIGSSLIMRPLILHASSKATGNSMRRVLHFVYAPASLPYGLRWLSAV